MSELAILTRARPPLDFVGIGAARCGTTWIAKALAAHPQIFIPARKELHYFDNDFLWEPSLRRVKHAVRAARPDQKRGEFTPRYMISERALDRIRLALPEAKLIVALRHPVERAFSQWRYFRYVKKKERRTEFVEALDGPFREDYVGKSCYATHLTRVLARFAREQVHIVLYDDLAEQPEPHTGSAGVPPASETSVLRELHQFIGVQPGPVPDEAARHINASDRGRAPHDAWARSLEALALGRSWPHRAARPLLRPAVEWANRALDRTPLAGRDEPPPCLDRAVRDELFDRLFAEEVERAEAMLEVDLSRWRPAGARAHVAA